MRLIFKSRGIIGESGEGNTAAVIGATGVIIAAIISGVFFWSSSRSSEPGTQPSDSSAITFPTAPSGDIFGPASVFLSRDSGPGGTTVNVSGEGFTAGERVVINFHTEQIGSTNANDEGSFSNVAVTIPSTLSNFAPQQFFVIATGQESIKSARAPFTLSG